MKEFTFTSKRIFINNKVKFFFHYFAHFVTNHGITIAVVVAVAIEGFNISGSTTR